MSKHTPEPWVKAELSASGRAVVLVRTEDAGRVETLAQFFGPYAHDNAVRTAAAINACTGIPTNALKEGAVKELVEKALAVANKGQVPAPGPHYRWDDEYYKVFNELRDALASFKEEG